MNGIIFGLIEGFCVGVLATWVFADRFLIQPLVRLVDEARGE